MKNIIKYFGRLSEILGWSVRKKLFVLLLAETAVVISIGFIVFRYIEIKRIEGIIGGDLTKMAAVYADNLSKFLTGEVSDSDVIITNPSLINALIESNKSRQGLSHGETIEEAKKRDAEWASASAASKLIDKILNNTISEYLRSFQKMKKETWNEIFITDEEGWLAASTGRTSDYYQADELWWQKAYDNGKGKDYISNIEYDESARSWGLAVARPVFHDGKVIGVIKYFMSHSSVNKLIESVQLSKMSRISVVNAEGAVLLDSVLLPGTLEKKYDSDVMLNVLKEKNGGYLKGLNLSEKESIIGFYPVRCEILASNEINLHILLTQPLGEALKPFGILSSQSLTVIAFLAVMLFAVNAFISDRILNPIIKLKQAAESVSAGDYSEVLEIKTGDEIERLAVILNELKGIIRNREKQLACRASEISALYEIGRAVAFKRSFDEVLVRVIGIIVENRDLKIDSITTSIYTMDVSKNKLARKIQYGFLDSAHEIALSMLPNETVTTLIDNKKTLLVPDVRNNRQIKDLAAAFYGNRTINSMYVYPISSKSGFLGLLIISSVTLLVLTGDEDKIIRIICDQISQGVENEKFFKDMFERHWEMYWMHEAALLLSSARDFEHLINAMTKIMMASCKAEKIVFVPVSDAAGIKKPGLAYGFYDDSHPGLGKVVTGLLNAYSLDTSRFKGSHLRINFEDHIFRDNIVWKQFRKEAGSEIVIPVYKHEDESVIGIFFIFSERAGAFSEERVIKLLTTYSSYIGRVFSNLKL